MARFLIVGSAVGLGLANALEDTSVLIQAHTAASAEVGLLEGRTGLLHALAAEAEQLPQGIQLPQIPQLKEMMEKLGSQLPPLDDVMKQLGSLAAPKPSSYDCDARPWMCQEPFNCHHDLNPLEMVKRPFQIATDDGHANLRTWCMPSAEKYVDNLVKHCLVEKDLHKSGQAVYEETRRGRFGATTAETDASYCFIEGHCSNTAVTENTTLEEAEQMCDFRYGHDGWAKNFGFKDLAGPKQRKAALWGGADLINGGFYHTAMSKPYVKAACAMGNFHCDVLYCRETYCQEPYYIKKYGHLLPKVPGHLIEDKEWVM
uniref:Uncharacterized protein n=1 Tax=Alexandrium andersonii TaxID=327968 RepID=A0A7S2NB25_9DINO|mmetsp:Transcript_89544/g.200347  ORF Transcript_89544/g.200347 Transcript_89544/m.200347 type:complete len:316 (+) Transcript_89544:35-982(+)